MQGYYIIWFFLLQLGGAFIALSPSGVGTAEVTELSWECVPLLDAALLFHESIPVQVPAVSALLHPLCHCGMSDSRGVGAGGDSCSSRVSHTRPAFTDTPGGLSATPGPQSSLLMFCSASGGAGLLLPALNWFLMPGKDDSVGESSSFHLIPHEKGLGQNKVLNGISEAIDPA